MSTDATTQHGSARIYAGVLFALFALTATTVTAAGINFGSPMVNVVIAMVIASIKASLVALFFMHLRYDKPLNAIIFCTGLVLLAVFLMLCFVDVESRPEVIPQSLKVPVPKAEPARSTAPAGH